MIFDDINATNFVDARSHEIQKLEEEIKKTSKKTLLFQRVPFHKRRRARNKEAKKIKFKAAKDKFLYYHKRFEMKNMFGTLVPCKRRQKSESFIAKSEDRGYIWFEKHKKVLLYKSIKGIQKYNNLANSRYNHEEYETYYFDEYLILFAMERIEIEGFKYIEELGVAISILKGKKEISGLSIDQYLTLNKDIVEDKKRLIDINAIVLVGDSFQTYKIITNNRNLAAIHHNLVREGYIPICINELFRLAIENKKLIYPFDFTFSKHYKDFESVYYADEALKWDRTPKSKRTNFDKLGIKDPWFLPNEFTHNDYLSNNQILTNFDNINSQNVEYITKYFECEKGKIVRMGMIFLNKTLVGYVLRGGYCYKIGKCRGVAVIMKNVQYTDLWLRNKDSLKYDRITIL